MFSRSSSLERVRARKYPTRSTRSEKIGNALAWGVVGLAVLAVGNSPIGRELLLTIHDAVFGASEQQQFVSDALSKAAGREISVGCVDLRLIPGVGDRHVGGAVSPHFVGSHDLLLDTKVCNDLVELSQVAGQPGGAWASDAQVWAAQAAAHEISHVLGDGKVGMVSDEAITECRGRQRLADVAEAFGANTRLANEMGMRAVEIGGDYTLPGDCYEGGPLDLDPAAPGNFPSAPPRVG